MVPDQRRPLVVAFQAPWQAQLLDVKQIYASDAAFAALKQDGSIVTWGHPEYGGDSSTIQDWIVTQWSQCQHFLK